MNLRRALAVIAISVLVIPVLSAAPVQARRKYTVEFRPVITELPVATSTTTTAPVDLVAARAAVASCEVAAVAALPVVPTTKLRAAEQSECVVFPDRSQEFRYYLGPTPSAVVKGIDDAKMEFLSGQGWTVKIEFTELGSKAWDRLGREQFHRQVAITLEGYVVSAPTIQPNDRKFSSFGGTAVVSGDFGEKEAAAIAAAIRAGTGR